MKAGLALTVLIVNVFAIVSILGARHGPGRKVRWTAAVVLIPLIGAAGWFMVGRSGSSDRNT